MTIIATTTSTETINQLSSYSQLVMKQIAYGSIDEKNNDAIVDWIDKFVYQWQQEGANPLKITKTMN